MSKWISVEDRLPELDKPWGDSETVGHYAEVLIYDGERVMSGSYDKFDKDKSGTWAESSGGYARGVTHWMPLPAPPKSKEVKHK